MAESFIDFLEQYGDMRPPEMPYVPGSDYDAWKEQFRSALVSLRGAVPDRVEPNMEVLDEVTESDHVRQTVRISVSEFSNLIAYLLLPTQPLEGRAVVASHGHTKNGIDTTCGVLGMDEGDNAKRAYGLEAVRSGYVVIAPAWWGWHGRDGHLDKVGGRDKCNVIQMAAAMYGMNVTDLHIQDGQAAVDVLANHPDVDADRIGCLGNSYGGRTTMWLSLFDERIKACVPAGCMNTFRERSLKLSSCGIQYLPGILRHGDVPELFCLMAPRAMQLQAGAKDGLITPEDRDAMHEKVRSAYEVAGTAGKYEYVLHPDGHFLKWDLAEPFLRRNL